MASSNSTPNQRALHFGFRALAIGVLGYVLVFLVTTTQWYATIVIAAGLLSLVVTDVGRTIGRFSRDVGQRVVAHDPNGAELEYFRTLVDTVAAALVVVAVDGGVRFVNRAAHVLFKREAHRLSDIAELDAAAADTLRGLLPGARQLVQFTDGRYLLCTAVQFSVPGHAPERLISLQRIAGELDPVEVKAWQDMARVIAHEMMNSLTPIASLSESLEVQLRNAMESRVAVASSDVVRSLEAIRRRSLGLLSFVERYRQVADLPSAVIEPVEGARLIADIEKLISAELADTNVRLVMRMTPPHATFPADAALLEQGIINLLHNAADATRNTTDAMITLDCTLKPAQVVISVTDNGVGLPENELDRIMLPFFSTKPEGSGIGLALVRHIALAHQGTLEVRAGDQRGTIAVLNLPIPEQRLPSLS